MLGFSLFTLFHREGRSDLCITSRSSPRESSMIYYSRAFSSFYFYISHNAIKWIGFLVFMWIAYHRVRTCMDNMVCFRYKQLNKKWKLQRNENKALCCIVHFPWLNWQSQQNRARLASERRIYVPAPHR